MRPLPFDPEERIFSLGDLYRLFQTSRSLLWQRAWRAGVFVFLCAIFFQSAQYEIEATFKESAEQRGTDVLCSVLGKGEGNLFDASPKVSALMKSSQVLKPLVCRLGLQVAVEGKPSLFHSIWELGKAEFKRPLTDLDPFRFADVEYEGEESLAFRLRIVGENRVEVQCGSHQKEACLGEKIDIGQARLTVTHLPKRARLHSSYSCSIGSWVTSVEGIRAKLGIKAHKTNASIYDLSIRSRDRVLGVAILNELMIQYQMYLQRSHDQVATEQLSYLKKRQGDLHAALEQTLNEYMTYLSRNIQEGGFISTAEECKIIGAPHRSFYQRACAAELEMEELALALPGKNQEQIDRTIQDLECQRDLIQASLSFRSSRELVSVGEQVLTEWPGIEKEENGYEGFDLETTRGLLVETTRQLDSSQAAIELYRHTLSQMEHSSFELTTLRSILKDPASEQLLDLASKLYWRLQDEENHSEKEIERCHREMALQRKILGAHLQQMIAVEELQSSLFQEKIASLQRHCLDCLNQKISVSQQRKAGLARERKESLVREKDLLERKMRELQKQMAASIPEKWRFEQLLKIETSMSTKIMESMVQLVESKTVGHHLHHIESKPLDYPHLPARAMPPHLMRFSLAGALIGAIGSFFWLFLRKLYRGFPAVPSALRALRYPFSGSISAHLDGPLLDPLIEEDLESLRKALLFLDAPGPARFIGVFVGAGPDYSYVLADLLAKSGKKILLIRSDFSLKTSPQNRPGLLQVLSSPEEPLPIRQEGRIDVLLSGGYSRFGVELIRSLAFADLLERCSTRYDHILLLNRAPLDCAECEALLRYCHKALVTVVEESMELLTSLIQWAYDEDRCRLTFLSAKEF